MPELLLALSWKVRSSVGLPMSGGESWKELSRLRYTYPEVALADICFVNTILQCNQIWMAVCL